MLARVILAVSIFILFIAPAYAQTSRDETLEATVIKVAEEKEISVQGKKQRMQKLDLLVTKGSLKGQKITVENGVLPSQNVRTFKAGDRVIVVASKSPQGATFYITDYVRRQFIYLLFGVFVVASIVIGRGRGITSLIGLVLSFIIILGFLLPQILAGQNPLTVSVFTALFIVPLTFYLSHGINKKTTAAVLGTALALIITAILAYLFVDFARLTGFASEEAVFLETLKEGTINLRGLLLAGIIIGTLGVLDDVTVSQAAIVAQLKAASSKLTFRQLYTRAMDVGRDHIASMVNTLVLVYTGAAMPLLLLFVQNPQPFSTVINFEIVAEEVTRTLVASIGLILAVPITTFIACVMMARD